MATIVVHKKTGERFVLIGTGLGVVADPGTDNPGDDALGLAFVCGPSGSIRVVRALDLIVAGVDGRAPSDILSD